MYFLSVWYRLLGKEVVEFSFGVHVCMYRYIILRNTIPKIHTSKSVPIPHRFSQGSQEHIGSSCVTGFKDSLRTIHSFSQKGNRDEFIVTAYHTLYT
jgi:hypothetical protein